MSQVIVTLFVILIISLLGALLFFYWRAQQQAIPITATEVVVEKVVDVYAPTLNNTRTLTVFLPPLYYHTAERYKVLYLNDGQDAEALEVKNTLETLYQRGKIEPIIVVAVPTNYDRLHEYGTAGRPDYKGRGAKAQAYTDFLVQVVRSHINRAYRTRTGPENTAVLGASLGGLSAFDIVWKHPEHFGQAGVFSGSFWWRTDDHDPHAKQESRIMHRTVRDTPQRPRGRFWFQAGTRDETSDRDNNGVIDAIQDTTELMDELALKGYRHEVDMVYVQVEGGEHNPATWAKALPEFLRWAFPPPLRP